MLLLLTLFDILFSGFLYIFFPPVRSLVERLETQKARHLQKRNETDIGKGKDFFIVGFYLFSSWGKGWLVGWGFYFGFDGSYQARFLFTLA